MRQRMTSIAGTVIGLPVSAFAGLWIAGSLIPRDHSATVTVSVAAPIDEVYTTISDYDTFHHWAPNMPTLERLGDVNGHRSYQMVDGEDAMHFTLIEERPPNRLVIETTADPPAFGRTWTWSLTPSQMGTEATLTEEGWVDPPLSRAIMTMMGWDDDTIRAHTAALKIHLEGEAG